MAHPQNNFTSQFQSDGQTGNAALTLSVNGENYVYTPQGTDQEVAITQPVVFELSENPTYAEVNEVVGAHIPCYLHVAGVGVDYMAPYVGNADDSFRFETTDTQNNTLLGWLIRNGASPVAYTSSYLPGTTIIPTELPVLIEEIGEGTTVDLDDLAASDMKVHYYNWSLTNKANVLNKPTDDIYTVRVIPCGAGSGGIYVIQEAYRRGDTTRFARSRSDGSPAWGNWIEYAYNVFTDSSDGLVPAPSVSDNKFLRDDGTWRYPITGDMGDDSHMSIVSQDLDGSLRVTRGKRLHWSFTYTEPSVELTATDITHGYAEFVFGLGDAGLQIAQTGNTICMKGYYIQTGNPLNGKLLSFYIGAHGTNNPCFLMDTGFQTYTEITQNGYDWKAFKAMGLTMNNNANYFDAILRVPLDGTESVGDTFTIPGNVNICILGIARNDT